MNYFICNDTAVAPWIASSFPIIKIVLCVLIALLSIFMIVAVLMQKGTSNGVDAVTGQMDTFYNKNKGGSLQGKIKKLTIWAAILLVVFCILFLIVNTIFPAM